MLRARKDGTIGMAKPCLACLVPIKNYKNIRYVYYTTDKGFLSKELAENMHTSHISAGNKI